MAYLAALSSVGSAEYGLIVYVVDEPLFVIEISSTGSGSAEVLMTSVINGGTITTDGSIVKVRVAIENRNPNIGSDQEIAYIKVSNNGGANFFLMPSVFYTYNAETMIAEIQVSRKSATTAFATASGISANLPVFSVYGNSAWDWSASTLIELIAQDFVSGPPLLEYVVALQLYVEKIIK